MTQLNQSSDTEALSVFISYSRDDLHFADQLKAALGFIAIQAMLDRHNIDGAEDWQQRLGELIRDADAVVFVLSPASAQSDMCAWEIAEALRLGKRIVPVVCATLGMTPAPKAIQSLNYIFFYQESKAPGSGFGSGLAQLGNALNSERGWIRQHTRLLSRAIEWDAGGRTPYRLITGTQDIAEAKAWSSRRPKDAPYPTELHLAYIQASEDFETARADEARQQLERLASANEDRERAIAEREDAFRKTADAIFRRTRLRNIALLSLSAIACIAVWQWWRAEEQRKSTLLYLREYEAAAASMAGMTMTVGMLAANLADSTTNFPDRLPLRFDDAGSTTETLEDLGVVFDELDRHSRVFIPNDLTFTIDDSIPAQLGWDIGITLAKLSQGDAKLSSGKVDEAKQCYLRALEVLDPMRLDDAKTKLRSDIENGRVTSSWHIFRSFVHGRLALVQIQKAEMSEARVELEKGLTELSAISEAPDGLKPWFERRLADLDRIVAPASGDP